MDILKHLRGGDLRSIGSSDIVAAVVQSKPELVRTLIAGIYSDDAVLRARCADALEKVASATPKLVDPFKAELLNEISKIDQQEVRWHVALIVPRLSLTASQRKLAQTLFSIWLESAKSNIVRVCSLQALFELSRGNPECRSIIVAKMEKLAIHGSRSLKARSRKLLAIAAKEAAQ
jgi:hypothetical protein